MKNLMLLILVSGFVTTAFGQEYTCNGAEKDSEIVSKVKNERANRIIQAPCIGNSISQLEADKEVDCIQPKESQIKWRCLGFGPSSGCAFFVDIICVSRIGAFTSNNKVVRLSIAGREENDKVIFTPELNQFIEFEDLKQKK